MARVEEEGDKFSESNVGSSEQGSQAGTPSKLATSFPLPQRLVDRFLVPVFGMACCAPSSPWLKSNLKF